MSEKYFSLESIKQDIEWLQSDGCQEWLLREVLERFEYGAIPAADVRPVVRGRWIDKQNPNWRAYSHDQCSVCGWWNTRNAMCYDGPARRHGHSLNFCPNCGADMREENDR